MMLTLLLRKILYALLLLWIISIIAFWLSKQVPGDEVMDYISIDEREYSPSANPISQRRAYARVASRRGLDLPEFYFSIKSNAIPDSVSVILPLHDREVVKQWIKNSHQGNNALMLYDKLKSGLWKNCDQDGTLCSFYNNAIENENISQIQQQADQIRNEIENDTLVSKEAIKDLASVSQSANQLLSGKRSFSFQDLIPRFHWNGLDNQYQRWVSGLFLQRPLTSTVDGRDAWGKIYDGLKWTLLMNGLALLLSIIGGVWIGIWSARHEGSKIEKWITWKLFALYALPSFWLGTLFIYFFASGELFSIFPAGGLGSHQLANNILDRWGIVGSHLFLPVMCLTLGSLAYVSRQMKRSVLHELKQPYITMLRHQGISDNTLVKRHAVRNALFPIITITGGAIPVLLSGSLVIEVIFSIPGMGRLMYTSLMARDWPVAFPILMLCALITIVSYLLTDIAYRYMDPRIKLMHN